VPAALEKEITDLWNRQSTDVPLTRLALRLGNPRVYQRTLAWVADRKAAAGDRLQLIDVLGQLRRPDSEPTLLKLLDPAEPAAVRAAALAALQPYPYPAIAARVMDVYPGMSPDLRQRAQRLLVGRPASARLFLAAVDAGKVSPKEVPFDQLRRILLHRDAGLNRIVEKHWGRVTPATTGEKRARIASINHMLALGKGDPVNGKALFTKNCATCHTLFGEGNKIGPDLTGTDRKNREFIITSIVDPSAVIRNEYVAYIVETKGGRLLTGLVAESTPKTITLLDEKNERTLLARDDIEEMKASPQSLMPEKILDPLDDQQIRDLFSYLERSGPVAVGKKK
jgi:putative heme-binding domain-containing protein